MFVLTVDALIHQATLHLDVTHLADWSVKNNLFSASDKPCGRQNPVLWQGGERNLGTG